MELYKDVTVYSRLLVEEEHARATLKKGMCGREAGKTTTDDDNLGHDEFARGWMEGQR